MKRRAPATDDGRALPSDLAAGPAPKVWASSLEWRKAGDAWSREHGLGHNGWHDLLDPEVRYAVSSLGRAHARHAGYRPPWEPGHRPHVTRRGRR